MLSYLYISLFCYFRDCGSNERKAQRKQMLLLYQNTNGGQNRKKKNIVYDIGQNGANITLMHTQLSIPHRTKVIAL